MYVNGALAPTTGLQGAVDTMCLFIFVGWPGQQGGEGQDLTVYRLSSSLLVETPGHDTFLFFSLGGGGGGGGHGGREQTQKQQTKQAHIQKEEGKPTPRATTKGNQCPQQEQGTPSRRTGRSRHQEGASSRTTSNKRN